MFALVAMNNSAMALEWQIQFCPSHFVVGSSPDQCTLSERPIVTQLDLADPQHWLRIGMRNDAPISQPFVVNVGPFYLAKLDLYAPDWQLLAQGGTQHPDGQLSLGAHRFDVLLEPGTHHFLLRIQTPNVSHWFVDIQPQEGTLFPREMNIALHLGMLLALTLIAVVGLSIRPTAVNFRLTLLIVLVLLTVSHGSGFAALYWPGWPAEQVGLIFISLVALRTVAWGWLYQGLVQPHFSHLAYRLASALSYVMAMIAVVFYWIDWAEWARWISLILILYVPILHTIGALLARSMDRGLKQILVGSLAVYYLLHLLALVLVTQFSGQSEAPITITRILDLAIPVLAMATVFLRNRASDQLLQQAERSLAQKQAQLEYENRINHEKRLLIDLLGHEIKNPLGAIGFATHNLKSLLPAEPPSAHRRLANISRATQDIDRVLQRCHLANRLESQALAAESEPLNVGELLQHVLRNTPDADRFNYHQQPNIRVMADWQLLETVARNLVENALKYGAPNSRINLYHDLDESLGCAGFTLCNDVAEYARPDPNQLSQRFYRQEGKATVRGTGLGLSLCYQLVDLMGGKLTFELTDQKICFRVRLKDV